MICFISYSDFTGKCVGVSGGDTIKVMKDEKQVKITLEGIDCPESYQDFCAVAKEFTSNLVFGKEVIVKGDKLDKYGRTSAIVFVGETNLNLELVKAGLAWHYKDFSKDECLALAEKEARENKKGLWSKPSPIPPWEFRKSMPVEPIVTVSGYSHSYLGKPIPESKFNNLYEYFKDKIFVYNDKVYDLTDGDGSLNETEKTFMTEITKERFDKYLKDGNTLYRWRNYTIGGERVPCSACSGRGSVNNPDRKRMGSVSCSECQGTGTKSVTSSKSTTEKIRVE